MDLISSLGGLLAAWMVLVLALGLVIGGFVTLAIVAWPLLGFLFAPVQKAERSPAHEEKNTRPPKAATDG